MPRILVCPLSKVDDIAAASGAGTVVTLVGRDGGVPSLPHLPAGRHVVVDVGDIVVATDGHVLPGADHVEALIALARAWDGASPLLVHCWAGVSRSTASAFLMACALDPTRDEAEVAREIRALSPTATPNPRLVALADAALGRSGRMVEAVRAIGRGVDCFEGVPFALEVGTRAP